MKKRKEGKCNSDHTEKADEKEIVMAIRKKNKDKTRKQRTKRRDGGKVKPHYWKHNLETEIKT